MPIGTRNSPMTLNSKMAGEKDKISSGQIRKKCHRTFRATESCSEREGLTMCEKAVCVQRRRREDLADTLTAISVLAKMLASLLRCSNNDYEDERNSQDEQDE